jgi:hypothetical protein
MAIVNRKLILGTCGVGLMLAEIASCSIDSRNPSTMTFNALPGVGSDASAPPDGSGAPQLSVAPATLDLGQAVVGAPSRTRVAILNSGTGQLAAPQVGLLMGGDPDFIVLHDRCERSLGPSERCDVRIQLVPSGPGPHGATLGIQSSGQSAEVPLAGVGLAAGPLIVAPAAGASGDFGGVVLGSSADFFFEVSNPLPDPSGPLGVALGEAQFQLLAPSALDECEVGVTTLANGQSCRLHVSFTPARRGASDALLVVTSPALGSSGLPLVGDGRLAPVLAVPDLVDFGNVVVGSAGQRTLRLENQGDEPLALSGLTLIGGAPAATDPAADLGATSAFSMQNSDCGGGKVLPGGGFCSVSLAFRPQVTEPNQQTQLVVGAQDGSEKSIALSGSGVAEGTLRIAPAAGSTGDFGALLVGASASQIFTLSNPSQQPSGPLAIAVFDDYTLVAPASESDCQPGITSLAGDQSCTIAVTLTPSNRGQHDGALTVGSALAGAVHLPLSGLGIDPARLEVGSEELDFGRVPTQTPVQQVVTLQNAGDLPVSGLQATLESPTGGEVVGFTIQSPCTADVGVGASCALGIQFLPTAEATYSAVLRLAGDTAKTSVLLSGRAFARGDLAIAPLEGAGEFGDVVLGVPRSLQFTLTNGGSAPSGRLTMTSTSNLFTVDPGDCNLAGLDAGASCTFSVTFTPATSDPIVANLSVQSPGAGETAQSLSGRGRAGANLTALNNRDLGRANVNQDALREPANQFIWTLTNEGDLDSGALAVTNTNEAEFIVTDDTCNGALVAGHATCTMDIRFRASAAGARAATVTVTDTVSAQALALTLTGTGVLIAQPGQSCVNAECASGQCTGGVCCDRECISSCQACSAAGVCVDQAERQPCGNGNGQCFGLEKCLLPEAQPCTGDDQCGSGQCEQRLGGQGLSDRICCLADCGLTGQQCNAQGQCEAPTLPEGGACGAAGQLQCGAGLECKACRGGGNQCTPPDGCCNGCEAGYVCNAGECGCPLGSNGAAQLDCGRGQCFLDRANACCPETPDCPAGLPVCDGSVGLCRECLQASDCTGAGTGQVASCTNFTCTYSCNTFGGFKDCGGGRCVQSAQCCGNQDCSNCQTCGNNGFCGGGCSAAQVCNAFNNTCGPPAAVGLGQQCNPQAQNCTAQPGLSCSNAGTCQCTGAGFRQCGNTCAQVECCADPDCNTVGGDVCNNGRCGCPAGQVDCGNGCTDTAIDPLNCGSCNSSCIDPDGFQFTCAGGQCQCSSPNEAFVRGDCRFVDGQVCPNDDLCAFSPCLPRFIDGDMDGVGSTILFLQCGSDVTPGFPLVGGDTDDADPNVQ